VSERIDSFRDLRVYQQAFSLQQMVFQMTKKFPKDELFSLTSQIRRSSRSVGANIAEAWQKRRYAAHFVSKLSDSDGEQAETQHWIETASASEYISPETEKKLIREYENVGRMLGKMMQEPEKWCGRFADK
jgi:four helix bundle protein